MPAVCGQDWDGSHLIGGQALIRSHGPPRVGGWGRQVIIRTASAMRQPVDWVRPHPDLKGLRVGARTVSLLPIASGKQGGIHHCHTEWGPTSLTRSDQPASRRLTGCGPHSPHHPSQSVMCGCSGRLRTVALGRTHQIADVSISFTVPWRHSSYMLTTEGWDRRWTCDSFAGPATRSPQGGRDEKAVPLDACVPT